MLSFWLDRLCAAEDAEQSRLDAWKINKPYEVFVKENQQILQELRQKNGKKLSLRDLATLLSNNEISKSILPKEGTKFILAHNSLHRFLVDDETEIKNIPATLTSTITISLLQYCLDKNAIISEKTKAYLAILAPILEIESYIESLGLTSSQYAETYQNDPQLLFSSEIVIDCISQFLRKASPKEIFKTYEIEIDRSGRRTNLGDASKKRIKSLINKKKNSHIPERFEKLIGSIYLRDEKGDLAEILKKIKNYKAINDSYLLQSQIEELTFALKILDLFENFENQRGKFKPTESLGLVLGDEINNLNQDEIRAIKEIDQYIQNEKITDNKNWQNILPIARKDFFYLVTKIQAQNVFEEILNDGEQIQNLTTNPSSDSEDKNRAKLIQKTTSFKLREVILRKIRNELESMGLAKKDEILKEILASQGEEDLFANKNNFLTVFLSHFLVYSTNVMENDKIRSKISKNISLHIIEEKKNGNQLNKVLPQDKDFPLKIVSFLETLICRLAELEF